MLGFSYSKCLKKLNSLQKKDNSIKSEAQKNADEIIEGAQSKALKIIQDANLFKNNMEDKFAEELRKFSESQVKNFEKTSYDFLANYQKELTGLREEAIKTIVNISKDIEKSNLDDIQSMLENYKIERMKDIDKQIYADIERISKIVLGKAISMQDHENLVMQALEKAKKKL